MVGPFAQYTHSGTSGCSVTGGYAYTGTIYPNFANKYFFADYCLGRISYLNTTTGVITHSPNISGTSGIRSFGEDINGELYFTNGSVIYRLIDSSFSTSEFENAGFSMYPNPAKNTFTIKSTTANLATNVKMYDLSGKLLLTQSLENAPENAISIESLSKGIYMVTVETSNGTSHTSKLIVE